MSIVSDLLNWQTMIIELIIGGVVAGILFWRQHKLQRVMDRIIRSESELKLRRKRDGFEFIKVNLNSLINSLAATHKRINEIVENPSQAVEILARIRVTSAIVNSHITMADETLDHVHDIIEPELAGKIKAAIRSCSLPYMDIDKPFPSESFPFESLKIIQEFLPELIQEIKEVLELVNNELEKS